LRDIINGCCKIYKFKNNGHQFYYHTGLFMEKNKISNLKFNFITITTVLFISEIVMVHFLYSSLNLFSTPLSIYATGKYWFLITSGLLSISVSYLIISFCLLKTDSPSIQLKIGSILLLSVGISTFFVATLQTDIGHTVTIHGRLHIVAAHIHFVLLPFSALFIAAGVRDTKLKVYKQVTFAFGLFCLGTILTLLFRNVLHVGGYSGIIQKSLIVVILFWILYSAQTLRRDSLSYSGNK